MPDVVEDSSNLGNQNETSSEASSSGNCLVTKNNRNNKIFHHHNLCIWYTARVKHGSINQHVLQPCSTPEPGELINLAVLDIKCSA